MAKKDDGLWLAIRFLFSRGRRDLRELIFGVTQMVNKSWFTPLPCIQMSRISVPRSRSIYSPGPTSTSRSDCGPW
jgi:hypothetical protein